MSKIGFDKRLTKLKRGRRKLLTDLAIKSKDHFEKNFPKQGFDDVPKKRWKSLKKPRPGLILVKTGNLLGSATHRVFGSKRAKITFGADYASFHNEGTGRLPKRQFSGPSKTLDKKNEKIILNYIKSILK